MKQLLFLVPLVLASMFCTLTGPSEAGSPTPDVAQMVSATLTALAANPQPEADTQTASISGNLGYPSEFIPPLRVVAFRVGSDQYFTVDTPLNQASYQISNLPAGTYHVVGYVHDPSGQFPSGLSGAYTVAIACGLTVECTDHSLVDVVLNVGQAYTEAHVQDWLIPDLPPMPGAEAGSVDSSAVETHGVVSGSLQYPSSFIPAMRIAAFPLSGGAPTYIDTVDGQSSYEIKLPPGQYHFVAYTMDGFFAGGYTAAVPCGLSVDCTDHSLLPVTVIAGQVTPNILPVDFYAPDGTFPPMP